ncbi:MAG: HNH endonuclease family protein [Ginsengibacter sp.]
MELNGDKIKIKDLLDLKRNGMLSVNPEYQRGAVWKEPQQKKLIDSVLRGYPLPLIYLHHKKKIVAGMQREDLEIIDGQQRINSLFLFGENALKLFDPVKDDKTARFPNFVKQIPCPWAHCDYYGLDEETRNRFDNTELFIVKVITENEDEARDLFIRLQAGLPLNAQEKRDAWPGGYTEFVLKFGGKRELARYPGHDFFKRYIKIPNPDRGEVRQLCAQIGMLHFEQATKGNWLDIGTEQIDDYYYRNLGFDISNPQVQRFAKVLNVAAEIFEGYKGPKLRVHEAIHVLLLIESLIDDYTKNWQYLFTYAFDNFRNNSAIDKKAREGEYWFKYGALTQTGAAMARTIQLRHKFFSEKMFEILKPLRKDLIRGYGQLEREIIYYRDNKKCAVCDLEIKWDDLEIHHLNEHQNGGKTTIENGISVHRECHPKGQAAIGFYNKWKERECKINCVS